MTTPLDAHADDELRAVICELAVNVLAVRYPELDRALAKAEAAGAFDAAHLPFGATAFLAPDAVWVHPFPASPEDDATPACAYRTCDRVRVDVCERDGALHVEVEDPRRGSDLPRRWLLKPGHASKRWKFYLCLDGVVVGNSPC